MLGHHSSSRIEYTKVKNHCETILTRVRRMLDEHPLRAGILERFADVPLLSRYDAYQRLMDYWTEVKQDDVYLIAAEGWLEAAKPRPVIDDRERQIKETPDLVVGRKRYKMDLVPPGLIVARYFADEQAAIDGLQVKQDAAARELEGFIEERHRCNEEPVRISCLAMSNFWDVLWLIFSSFIFVVQ